MLGGMKTCPYCGATGEDSAGCRHCDSQRATSRIARSEVSFGPFGRLVLTCLFAAVVAGAFFAVHHSLDAHPLAWLVLAAFSLVLAPVVLLGIWKPVRHPRHH